MAPLRSGYHRLNSMTPRIAQTVREMPFFGSDANISCSVSDEEDDFREGEADSMIKHSEPRGDVDMSDEEPTAYELRVLRKVPDSLPWSAFLVCVVELCERFTFYGLSGPFQNYISNSYNDPSGNPGAIGLGQSAATALTNFFLFWCYCSPIIGAVVADQYLGRYKTIIWFSFIYLAGSIVLFLTSLPKSIEAGAALPGFIVALICIGLGTGGIKANVSPLIAEQYQGSRHRVKFLKSGEKVIVSPELTIQRIYMVFYMAINVGSLSSIATTELELNAGFWAAYLLPLVMFIMGICILIAGRKRYVVRPPKGSIIPQSLRILWIGMSSRGGLESAKPSDQGRLPDGRLVLWDANFVDELRQALSACKTFPFFIIYWTAYSQMLNNFISQAGTMELHGIPNDIMGNIDPITIIIFIPILDRLIYPWLRNFGIQSKPISRIFWGFIMGAIGIGYAAFVQKLIYSAPPCYEYPLSCDAGKLPNGDHEHNHVHVALQAPTYFFIAISEIFANVTGLEYSYSKAPASMKSLIMALFMMTNAIGAVLGAAIAPFARNPNLVWLYTTLSVATLATGLLFWACFRKYNLIEASPEFRLEEEPLQLDDMIPNTHHSSTSDSTQYGDLEEPQSHLKAHNV